MASSRGTAESVRWAVSRLATRLRAEQPGPEPLTRLAASVLANLRHGGPTAVTRLAELEGLQPQSLTRTLQALESEGRVNRVRDEDDGRAQRISLTEAGQTALDEHVEAGNQWLADALESALTPAERQVLDIAAELLLNVVDHDDPPGRVRASRRRPSRPPAAPL